MKIKNTRQDYGIVEKILHWLIAILVLCMLSGGFFLDDVPESIHHQITNLHKLTGITILGLMVLRLIWRFCNTQPKLPATTPHWQALLAHLIHWLLYLTVIAMPLAGWIMSTASGKAPHIGAWVIRLPWVAQDKAISSLFWNVHVAIAWILIGLISLHILAALKHALIDRDGILARMWF